jgi:hypothetical protein
MDKWNWADAAPWVFAAGAGMIGRLMYHAKQVQAGKRKPFSWVLLWDIPIALGMGWIAIGLGKWLHTPWEATISLALVCAYLGPYGLDTVFAKYADWKFKKEGA